MRSVVDEDAQKKGFFAFELTPRFVELESKRLFTNTPEERDGWVAALLQVGGTYEGLTVVSCGPFPPVRTAHTSL